MLKPKTQSTMPKKLLADLLTDIDNQQARRAIFSELEMYLTHFVDSDSAPADRTLVDDYGRAIPQHIFLQISEEVRNFANQAGEEISRLKSVEVK